MREILIKACDQAIAVFFTLVIIFVPFQFNFQFIIASFLFSKPVYFLQNSLFSYALKKLDFSSDTIGLNILIGMLVILSIVVASTLFILKRNPLKLIAFIRLLIV